MCEGSCMEDQIAPKYLKERTPILPPGGNPQARKVKVPPSTFLDDIQNNPLYTKNASSVAGGSKDQTLLMSLTKTNPSLRYWILNEAMEKEYNRKRGKAIDYIPFKEGISQYGEVDPEYHIEGWEPQDYHSYIDEFYGGSDYEVAEDVADVYSWMDYNYLREIHNIFKTRDEEKEKRRQLTERGNSL